MRFVGNDPSSYRTILAVSVGAFDPSAWRVCSMAMPDARILVPCMDWQRPAGGVRKIYQYVDWLNEAGFDAVVMHQQAGFRCRWFESTSRVASFHECWPPRPGDTLIVPEILAWQFVSVAPDTPKIILNQNVYQTFAWATEKYNVNPYTRPEVHGVIVVSEDSRQYMNEVFPALAGDTRTVFGRQPAVSSGNAEAQADRLHVAEEGD